jgi:hypothetical protein
MTIVSSDRSAGRLVMGWSEDPAVTTRQVTHAVEPGHRVGVCGARVALTGGPWTGLTRLSRCAICRQAARVR